MRGTQMRSNSPDGRRKRGSTLVLFTLMLPTLLIPLMGLGIDATMLYIVQAKLSAATDGAALGAGRLLGTLAKPADIRAAGGFRAKPRLELAEGPWVICSAPRHACITHAPILSVVSGCVKCIPTFLDFSRHKRTLEERLESIKIEPGTAEEEARKAGAKLLRDKLLGLFTVTDVISTFLKW